MRFNDTPHKCRLRGNHKIMVSPQKCRLRGNHKIMVSPRRTRFRGETLNHGFPAKSECCGETIHTTCVGCGTRGPRTRTNIPVVQTAPPATAKPRCGGMGGYRHG